MCVFIVPLKIKENLRVVQQLQSELPLISLYQIICRRKLMSVANEIKIKYICICEFVNPIDAFVQIEIELTCKTANCALRFAALATPHATHTHVQLSRASAPLLACCCHFALCNNQIRHRMRTLLPSLGDSFAMATKFNCFFFLSLLASLQSSYEMLRTKR